MTITVNTSLSLNDNKLARTFSGSQTATTSETGYYVEVPSLGTASSQMQTATLTSLGYAYMQSLVTTTQATCTITFGRLDGATMHDVVTMRPGEIATLRLAPGNYAAKGADEDYRLLFAVIED